MTLFICSILSSKPLIKTIFSVLSFEGKMAFGASILIEVSENKILIGSNFRSIGRSVFFVFPFNVLTNAYDFNKWSPNCPADHPFFGWKFNWSSDKEANTFNKRHVT